jgi:hypothetical protein
MSSQNNENENISSINRQNVESEEPSTFDNLKASVQRGAEKIKESAEVTFEDLKSKIEMVKEGTKDGADNIKQNTNEQLELAKEGKATTTEKISEWAHDTWDYITGKDADDKEDVKKEIDDNKDWKGDLKDTNINKDWKGDLKDSSLDKEWKEDFKDSSINKDWKDNDGWKGSTDTAMFPSFGKTELGGGEHIGHFDTNRSAAIQEPLLGGSNFEHEIKTGHFGNDSSLADNIREPHLAQTVFDRPSEFGQPGHGQTSIDKTPLFGDNMSGFREGRPELHRTEGTFNLDKKFGLSQDTGDQFGQPSGFGQSEFRQDLNRTADPVVGTDMGHSAGIASLGQSNFGAFQDSSSFGSTDTNFGSNRGSSNLGSSNLGSSSLESSNLGISNFNSSDMGTANLTQSNIGLTGGNVVTDSTSAFGQGGKDSVAELGQRPYDRSNEQEKRW